MTAILSRKFFGFRCDGRLQQPDQGYHP